MALAGAAERREVAEPVFGISEHAVDLAIDSLKVLLEFKDTNKNVSQQMTK